MYSIFKLRRTESQWQQETGLILFTWGILNPNGPTLSCVGVRESGCPGELEVFYRWLHFLGGESFVLGYVSGDSEDLAADIKEVLSFSFRQEAGRAMRRFPMVTCVPNFVTLPATEAAQRLMNDTDVRDLISGCRVFRETDWGRQTYYLTKYGSRFFDRAAEETREAVEQGASDPNLTEDSRQFFEVTRLARSHLPGFNDWTANRYQPRAMADGDVDGWWSTVIDEEFTLSCLVQLAQAWVGAAHLVRQTIPEPVEPFELVKEFVEFHRNALWPEAWDSASLRQNMGLVG